MTAERAIGAALALFTALLGIVRSKRSAAFDLAVTLKMQQRETPALAALTKAASWPGFPPQSRLIPPAIVLAWWARRGRGPAIFQLLAWGGALVSTVVKAVMRRPRPLPPAGHLVRALLGRAIDSRIRRYRAATVRGSTHRPMPVRADSVDLGTTPLELMTRAGALRVIAPIDGATD